MDYRFSYEVRPEDLWVLSMSNIYRSMAGTVNIIFTASMVMLAIRFWSETNLYIRIILVAGISLFPILQPLFILLRSGKLSSRMPGNLEMVINPMGFAVSSGKDRSQMAFSELDGVIKIRGMLILYTKSKESFILNRQALGGKGEELFAFLSEKIEKE